jgi:hypothetical protein
MFGKLLPASLLGVVAVYCQIALVDESGRIRTQTGTYCRSEIVAVHGTPCAIPPRNSNNVHAGIATLT